MRFSSATLLLAGALAAGAAMFNCAPAGEEAPAADSAAITGLANTMGLRLVYDEKSGTIRATLRRKLEAGETLHLQVRRGRLSAQSQSQLDCSSLPQAGVTNIGTGSTVVYQGPNVDPSLLATVYDDQWIMDHVTPAMLEELLTRGADAIAEACVMRDEEIKARVQTTIAFAWDQSDPSLAGHSLIASGGVGGGGVTIAANTDPSNASHGLADALNGHPIRSMEKYAEVCVDELGEIPFFPRKDDGTFDTFDCRNFTTGSGLPIEGLEAAMIPQEQHDAAGNKTTPEECDDTQPGSANCWKNCDHPDWRSQTCEPGPTVASAKNSNGTHWTILCRSPGESTDTVATRKSTTSFNDIAMIGHNPKTGKTCFFQNKIHEGKDGAHITHPADVERSREIWDAPKGYCGNCHSADAFVHSPWIDQAKRSTGMPIVPKMGDSSLPEFAISSLNSPYSVIQREAQNAAKVGGSEWPKAKHLVSEEASACLACHRIGNGDGMKRFPMWSIGEDGLPSDFSGTGTIAQRYSPQGATFASTHWMPPRVDAYTPDSFKQSPLFKAVAHIKTCAENESAPGCVWADVRER